MDESYKIAGVTAYLRKFKTPSELNDIAHACFASATEEVTITSIGTEGASSSGVVSYPRAMLLKCVMAIIQEEGGGRQIMSYPNYRSLPSQT